MCAALVSLQKCFVVPVRSRAQSDSRRRRIHINQTAGDAANSLVGKTWHQPAHNVRLVMTGRIRKKNYLATRILDGGVLSGGLAQSYWLSHQLYAALSKRLRDFVSGVGRTIGSDNYIEKLARI